MAALLLELDAPLFFFDDLIINDFLSYKGILRDEILAPLTNTRVGSLFGCLGVREGLNVRLKLLLAVTWYFNFP